MARRSKLDKLYMHEEILLLTLHDESGKLEQRAGMYQYALSAGIMAELLLSGRVSVEDRKQLVNVESDRPLRNDVLDECLEKVATARRRRRMRDWVTSFASIRRFKQRVAARLVDAGILEEAEGKVLFFFTRRLYPERDHQPEQEIVERMRAAIFGRQREADARTAVLVSLAHGAGLLPIHFDRKELRQRKERIKAIAEGDVIGGAARQAIQAAQSAAAMAAIMPAIMAAGVSS